MNSINHIVSLRMSTGSLLETSEDSLKQESRGRDLGCGDNHNQTEVA